MAAWFETNEGGGAPSQSPGSFEGFDLGVRPAAGLSVAFAYDPAVADDDATNVGIGADAAVRLLSELEGPLHPGGRVAH
jgi:hypothetical protein